MFALVGHIIVSLCLALLAMIVLVSLLIWGMNAVYPRSLSNIGSFFFIGVGGLAVMLFVQSFLFSGACYAKKYLNAADENIQRIVSVSNVGEKKGELQESIKAQIITEFPLFGRYLDDMNTVELGTCLTDVTLYLHSSINDYLWRRVLWIIGALISVGGILFYRAGKEEQRIRYLRQRMMEL